MHKILMTIFAPLELEEELPVQIRGRAKEIGATASVNRAGHAIARRHDDKAVFELELEHADAGELTKFAQGIIKHVYA